MTWESRTRPAAYTSPGGVRVPFDYEQIGKSFEKNTSAHTFPGVDGTYIQDMGTSSRRYPTRAIFWGENHDTEAADMIAALSERGRGTLEHPRDGVVQVIPYGSVTTREDLVAEANQTIIEVEFWESIGDQYPAPVEGSDTAALAAVDDSFAAAQSDFTNSADFRDPVTLADVRNRIAQNVAILRAVLRLVAGLTPAKLRKFNSIADSIIANLDSVGVDPSIVAGQVVALTRAPGGADAIAAASVGYGNAVDALTTRTTGGQGFKVDELFAMATATAYTEVATLAAYTSRPGAQAAAAEVSRQQAKITPWREVNYAVDLVDTGESYAAMQNAAALSVGYLTAYSFELIQERRIVLGRARTIIELAGELFGEVDAQLDRLIGTNRLTGDDLVELPVGREIVYYV